MRLMPQQTKTSPQVLVQLHLDEKHRQLYLQLLSKVCKAQHIIPTSYILRAEFLRIGSVRDRGGFSEVPSDGEYLGRAVAIKDLKQDNMGFNKNFKVHLITSRIIIAKLSTSGLVKKLLVGNIYLTRIFCL